MNWKNTSDVLSTATETWDMNMAIVPEKGLIAKNILHKYSVTENKKLWDWIPIHPDT